ncbi:MAG: FtsX-like permease family protein [Gammaproteobacteria bacterium]|nr:FtsX-like permease family protein [Gammaproteobacteria bacterium]
MTETIRISLMSIRGNLFRALLTMLGIIIGVGAVITMVALGTGAQRAIDEQMAALGGDILSIQSSSWFSRGVARDQQTLTTDDAMALAVGSEHVSDVVPEISSRFQIKYGNKNFNLTTIGTTPNYPDVHGFTLAHGEFISPADNSARRRVVVLGSEIPGMLEVDAALLVGQKVQIRSITFEIIGVMEAKGGSGWRNPDDDIWIPLSTAQFRVTGNEFVQTISAKVSDASTVPMAMLEIERVLRREHGVLPGKDNDFAIMNRKQFAQSRQEATQVFTYLLAGIAGVSLVVGGIGIMNIMLVTVTERTREIGVRKALGATKGNILLQFLVESTILCLLGGLLGLALGAGASALLAKYAGWQTVVTSESAIMAFGFSAAVGMIFGIWPAKRAAGLDPIEALRHE